MSQALRQTEQTIDLDLALIYQPIAHQMPQVEDILRSQLKSDSPFVDQLLRYGCLLGGKRLRPALLLLVAQALDRLSPQHLTLAAVIEMIHTATLIHDDVLDEADTRRHLATVNARWNNESSVLLGDYLFTHAFYLASTLDSPVACRMIGQATNTVCEGELRQVGSRENYDLSEHEYYRIIEAKTAELCACATALGALFAGAAPDQVERFDRYGRYVGIAFQIADDILDVVGVESATGKSLGTDLEKQKPTLPLIRTLQLADADQRHQLIQKLTHSKCPTPAELLPWLEQFDAVQFAQQQAQQYAQKALDEIEDLPESPATRALRLIPRFVVSRTH